MRTSKLAMSAESEFMSLTGADLAVALNYLEVRAEPFGHRKRARAARALLVHHRVFIIFIMRVRDFPTDGWWQR